VGAFVGRRSLCSVALLHFHPLGAVGPRKARAGKRLPGSMQPDAQIMLRAIAGMVRYAG
jgi:hypothetical protein